MPHVRMSYPLCLVLAGLAWPMAAAGERITAPDLIRMQQGGLKEATILDFIQVYQARLSLPEGDWAGLSGAGFSAGAIQALREYALAHPAPAEPGPSPAKRSPLPRFFVGYPHDPAAFPAWYYGPFSADASSASQYPGRGNARGGRWRNHARAVWFHGRRL